jgi:cytochrome c oxidase assembly factor CtaG
MPLATHCHEQPTIVSLVISVILFLTSIFYVRGWICFRRAVWRLAAFLSGVFVIWVVICSPLAVLDHQLLTAHMLKHLLLMTVATPLILLGATRCPLKCGVPKRFVIGSFLLRSRTPPFIERFLSNSVLCWFAGSAAVIAWHIPALFQLGLLSPTWHMIEDTSFICAGLLFWLPILRIWPRHMGQARWSMPVYLFLATLPCDILSAFLTFCGRVIYPGYLSTVQRSGFSALQDQECAGALMWTWATFAYLIPAVVITMQILAPSRVPEDREPLRSSYGSSVAEISSSEMEVV